MYQWYYNSSAQASSPTNKSMCVYFSKRRQTQWFCLLSRQWLKGSAVTRATLCSYEWEINKMHPKEKQLTPSLGLDLSYSSSLYSSVVCLCTWGAQEKQQTNKIAVLSSWACFLLTVDFQGGFCLAKLVLSILLLVICHGRAPPTPSPAPQRHCSRGHFFCRPCKISACFIHWVHIEAPLVSFLLMVFFFSVPPPPPPAFVP